jgi:Acyl-CoA dehydrogenase, N-terminal domain
MPAGIRFPTVGLPGSAEELRAEVREFLSCEITAGAFSPRCDSWLGEYSPEFSRKLGERGWLGMTWRKRYGGHERSLATLAGEVAAAGTAADAAVAAVELGDATFEVAAAKVRTGGGNCPPGSRRYRLHREAPVARTRPAALGLAGRVRR